MPLVDKNIWVAAGDGDISRVRELIEHQSISPNVPDSFTYTPMHAAASYGHLDILSYLISKGTKVGGSSRQLIHIAAGGNVNVSDEDGDTPLYTVESIETARLLVDNGADILWRNHEGLTPAASLVQDFPQVAGYLNSIIDTPLADSDSQPEDRVSSQLLIQQSQEATSERLTSSLMSQLRDIAQNEAGGDESHRDEELRQVVGRAVMESLIAGFTMTDGGADTTTSWRLDQTDGQ